MNDTYARSLELITLRCSAAEAISRQGVVSGKNAMSNWLRSPVKGLLLDITGVLYDSGEGGGRAIAGSVEAVKKLQKSHLPFRFVSNETTNVRQGLVDKLTKLGFELRPEQCFTPAPAAAQFLRANNLRPHLLVHPGVIAEFADVDQSDPNCVLMGDAEYEFNNANMNKCLQILMILEKPILYTMGAGKFYMETDGLKIDVGAYGKALEYACDIKSEVIGKPSKTFFLAAVQDMGLSADQVVMIGDDIISDVGGSQTAGLRGVQVRTGKWRPEWQNHPTVKPDGIVDNLADAVQQLGL